MNNSSEYTVLLVEDIPLLQQVTVYQLNSFGCQVDVASNGAKAIQAAIKNHYDIIFLDLGLPDIDGVEVCRTIRQTHQINTPIIALTTCPASQRGQECLNAGMNAYLVKPASPLQLSKTLYDWV